MDKKELSNFCKKPLATVHCSCGDYKITGLCAIIAGGIVLFHIIMCCCRKCSNACMKKKYESACGCTDKCDC